MRVALRIFRVLVVLGSVLVTWAALLAGAPPARAGASDVYSVTSLGGGTYRAQPSFSGTTYQGRLKHVVESAVAVLKGRGGGQVRFGSGTFDYGSEYARLANVTDITFAGQGMDATIIRNSSSASADTEPFNFGGTNRVVIRDLTVAAGGPFRSTSDAIDFDNGNNSVVERVKITASRSRGIVFDGKDGGGAKAEGNRVTGCVMTSGVRGDGIELLAASRNVIEGCTITGVGGHGIQVTKSSTQATQPNKKSNDNIVRNNRIDQAGEHGLFINSSDRNQLTGNRITNSSDNVSGRDGIRIGSYDSVSAEDNVVSSNVATDTQATKTQKYGLHLAHALCRRTVVGPGNDFRGNLSGAIRNAGTGTIFR